MSLASPNAANACLHGGLDSVMLYVSAHTASPGTSNTVANEVTGGSYTRQSVSWASPSAGSMASSGSVSLSIPGSTTVTHVSTNSASSGSTTNEVGAALGASVTFGSSGTLAIASGALSMGVS